MPREKKSYGERISRFGFIDIEMRDADNNTVFKNRGQKLGRGIKQFENFLEQKFGIKGFSAFKETPQQKKKRRKEQQLKF